MAKRSPVWAIGGAIVLLALYGIWLTAHATWVIAHGGNPAFDGAFDYPTWSVAHFVPALVLVLILPFQLWARFRQAWPRVHRVAGRVAAACGAMVAATGVTLPWMMPARPFGERAFMMTAGTALAFLFWRGIAAARRLDFVAHRQWMLRVTAVALGPLTERVIFPFFAAAGIDSMFRFWDLFVSALWFSVVINVAVLEWWMRRTARSLRIEQPVLREQLAG